MKILNAGVFIAFALCSIALGYTMHLYSSSKRIKDLAQFCIRGNLIDALQDAQLKTESKYSIISDADYDYAKKILDAYREHITHAYFTDNLELPKGMRSILNREFFMLTLCSFLHTHLFDIYFLGELMHLKMLSRKDYDCGAYDAEYALSDFGIVINKLYYISYISCKGSKVINPDGRFYTDEVGIRCRLDSGRIEISRV